MIAPAPAANAVMGIAHSARYAAPHSAATAFFVRDILPFPGSAATVPVPIVPEIIFFPLIKISFSIFSCLSLLYQNGASPVNMVNRAFPDTLLP